MKAIVELKDNDNGIYYEDIRLSDLLDALYDYEDNQIEKIKIWN